jgi:hypothetical protein
LEPINIGTTGYASRDRRVPTFGKDAADHRAERAFVRDALASNVSLIS